MGGEKAKAIGDEAEDKVLELIRSLKYRILETNNEEYDIDCIAQSPPENPVVGLARPCYSPRGRVAFEVRESSATKFKIDAFSAKVEKYNSEKAKKLSGGIYIVGRRVSFKILEYMRKRQIWGWDDRRERLYTEKLRAFHYWMREMAAGKAYVKEIRTNNNFSYIQTAILPPTRSKQLLYLSVFVDDMNNKLSPETVKKIMNRIKMMSISPVIRYGIRPLGVAFEFFSISGLSKNLVEETTRNIFEPWTSEGIIATFMKEKPFVDYRTFTSL
jgi:hypothetical protein